MAVIEQDYDIDLKSTGAFPVVKCSQFDTGSREIVFTVYDNWELANIYGCVARVDGTRNDGTEFSISCSVSEGSKVSFTITQEMTKTAGKHTAELVIIDASGNVAGTQNFVIDVEPATMLRASAASADDRTIYDQFTASMSKSIDDKMTEFATKYENLAKPIVEFGARLSHKQVNLEYATILCIGDSFGDKTASDHGAWTTELATMLPNAHVIVKCQSGTGFWRAFGTNFRTQLQYAKNDGANPDFVIIAGGVNDTDAPIDQLRTSVSNTLSEAVKDFPDAQIVLIPMMAGYYHLTLKRRKVAQAIMGVAAQMGIPFARYMWWWNVGVRDNVIADNLHPTQKGARLLAHVILAFLQGREILPTTVITEKTWNDTGTLRYWVSSGRVHVSWQGNITDVSKFDHILNLPDSIATTATERMFAGYSVSGTKPMIGTFEIADNVEGMKFKITTPIEAGQMQIMLEYEV